MQSAHRKQLPTSRLAYLFAILLAAVTCRADGPGVEFKTAHYDLYVEGSNPADAGAAAEAIYLQLSKFFNDERHQPLRVKIFSDEQHLHAAMAADGVKEERHLQRQGMFFRAKATAYARYGLEGYEPYEVLRHECTHQFHLLTRHPHGGGTYSAAYTEGLAEHFELDPGDAATKRNDRHVLSWPDLAAVALEDFNRRHQRSFKSLATESRRLDTDVDYGGGWGLVTFLIERHPSEFKKWSDDLDIPVEPGVAWSDVFGDASDAAMSREYSDWLAARQTPWKSAGGDWHATTATEINGTADDTGECVSKLPIKSLAADIELQSAKGAGIGFDELSPKQYKLVWVSSDGVIHSSVVQNDDGSEPIALGKVADSHHFHIELKRTPDGSQILINGKSVFSEAGGVGGESTFIVMQGAARFRSIEYHQ